MAATQAKTRLREVNRRHNRRLLVDLVDVREGRPSDALAAGGFDPSGYYVWELRGPRACQHVAVRGQLGLWAPRFEVRLAA